MLQGPLALKRIRKISIHRRDSPDDDAETNRILPPADSEDTSIESIFIPVLNDDTVLPGGPVLTEPAFVAYIDDRTKIRTGDIVRRAVNEDEDEEPDLYVTGHFVGEISQRLDLNQKAGSGEN